MSEQRWTDGKQVCVWCGKKIAAHNSFVKLKGTSMHLHTNNATPSCFVAHRDWLAGALS